MKRYQDKDAIRGIISLTAAVGFLLIFSTPITAQRPLSPAERKARERTRFEQDLQLRGLVNEKNLDQSQDQNQLRQVIEQTKVDFERIQVIDRGLMLAVIANNGFDYKSLTESTAELRKRARRLKDNMRLPPPAEEQANYRKQNEIGQAEMKQALLQLNDRIVSFITNPLFQATNWIDVQLGAKASRDLEVIIELSGDIKKSAERLSKPSK
jgi:hypothetical protein